MAQKILIIDDDKALRDVLSEQLIASGIDAAVAENGEVGLKKALEMKPNLILLDVVMPVMDGHAFLKQLREDEWGKYARVVFLTNMGEMESVSQALEGNVSAYLVKTDWRLPEIVAEVKKLLG